MALTNIAIKNAKPENKFPYPFCLVSPDKMRKSHMWMNKMERAGTDRVEFLPLVSLVGSPCGCFVHSN